MNREVKTIFLREIDSFFLALRVCDLDSKRRGVGYTVKIGFDFRLSE